MQIGKKQQQQNQKQNKRTQQKCFFFGFYYQFPFISRPRTRSIPIHWIGCTQNNSTFTWGPMEWRNKIKRNESHRISTHYVICCGKKWATHQSEETDEHNETERRKIMPEYSKYDNLCLWIFWNTSNTHTKQSSNDKCKILLFTNTYLLCLHPLPNFFFSISLRSCCFFFFTRLFFFFFKFSFPHFGASSICLKVYTIEIRMPVWMHNSRCSLLKAHCSCIWNT